MLVCINANSKYPLLVSKHINKLVQSAKNVEYANCFSTDG